MLACWRVSQQENEAHGAPDAEEDENDRDEGQLAVRHGCQRVGHGAAGQNWPVFRQRGMLGREKQT